MKNLNLRKNRKNDRVEGDRIILNGQGKFPKPVVIIFEPGKVLEYRLVKTRSGKFQLNK